MNNSADPEEYLIFDYLYNPDDFVAFLNKTFARTMFDKGTRDKPLLFRNSEPLGNIRFR